MLQKTAVPTTVTSKSDRDDIRVVLVTWEMDSWRDTATKTNIKHLRVLYEEILILDDLDITARESSFGD